MQSPQPSGCGLLYCLYNGNGKQTENKGEEKAAGRLYISAGRLQSSSVYQII